MGDAILWILWFAFLIGMACLFWPVWFFIAAIVLYGVFKAFGDR